MKLPGFQRENLKHIADKLAVTVTGVAAAFDELVVGEKENPAFGAGDDFDFLFAGGWKKNTAEDILGRKMFKDIPVAVIIVFDQIGFAAQNNTDRL